MMEGTQAGGVKATFQDAVLLTDIEAVVVMTIHEVGLVEFQ